MAEQAGEAYHAFIKDQVDEERATKNSLEQRGVFVITSSAALGTLLFGFAALAKKPEGLALTDSAKMLLVVAAIAFVVAAVVGIAVNWPRIYEEALPEDLKKVIDSDEDWHAPLAEGYQVVSETRTRIVAAARDANRAKAWFVTAAMAAEVAAVFAVAWALIIVVRGQ